MFAYISTCMYIPLFLCQYKGKSHNSLYGKLSESLDQHLNNEVSRQLLEDYPVSTKTDLILECAQDGAIGLLKKWPDMKYKLHMCFNQPLPPGLRQVAWKLFLENTKGTSINENFIT